MKILLVDDDVELGTMLSQYLIAEGFDAQLVLTGSAGIQGALSGEFTAMILDIMLPDMSGIDVLRQVRQNSRIPVIMLTARGEEDHKVQGLDAGADDYMTKPFSTRELVSRIKAVLRRSNALNNEKLIEAEKLQLDPVSQRVSYDGKIIEIGPTEYRLLAFFMTHPERAYTRAQLLDQVWGGNVYIEDRTIDVHIRRLRKILEPFHVDQFVQTVRGTGYRFSTRIDQYQ